MEAKLIEIKQDRDGFNQFVGSWLCRDDLTLLADVGPANSASRLLGTLERLQVDRLDWILLSHIHIDHAGALADVLERYPMAKVVCHEKAVSFLVDPERLWAGSLKVLGEVAALYGKPTRVPKERIVPHTECFIKGVTIIETPGHAPHHLSFTYEDRLFSGEAAGNFLMVEGKEYLRPATPPRFFLEVFLKSLDRLLSFDDQPIFYAHFGKAESSHRMLTRFRGQILSWSEWIQEEILSGKEQLERRCVDVLLSKDPNLEAFDKMDRETQKRERNFIANAIRGFLGFFSETGP